MDDDINDNIPSLDIGGVNILYPTRPTTRVDVNDNMDYEAQRRIRNQERLRQKTFGEVKCVIQNKIGMYVNYDVSQGFFWQEIELRVGEKGKIL